MKRFYFEKLVRDKIVERNESNKDVIHTEYKVLDDVEYRQELIKKIVEEAVEIPLDDINREEALKEIGDLQSVVDTLRDSLGISASEVDGAMKAKADEAGSFLLRHYIEYVDITNESKWVERFRSQPEKYREEDA